MQIRKNRSTILVIIYLLFGFYCFVLGDSGILERKKLVQYKDAVKDSIAGLSRENKTLEKQYSAISNSRTNGDFYKKEASKSGFIAEGEKYIFFKANDKKDNAENSLLPKQNKYPVEISHLRILWIAASVMILIFYFMKRNKDNKEKKEDHGI